jgi:hypothetical protein
MYENLPSPSKFSSVELEIACKERYLEYMTLYYKIKSSYFTAEMMSDEIASLLSSVIGKGKKKSFDNMDSSGLNNKFGNSIDSSNIPDCLKDNLYNDLKLFLGTLRDTLSTSSFNFPKIDTPEFITRLSDILSSTARSLERASSFIADIAKTIVDPIYRGVFSLIDKFSDFIRETNLVSDLQRLKELKDCIRQHCPQLASSLPDDSFMYNSNLPIDMNTGKFRSSKVIKSKHNSEFDDTYYSYQNDKKRIADNAADTLEGKVQFNPFREISNNMEYNKIVNTLKGN